jgi:hypothetical protein
MEVATNTEGVVLDTVVKLNVSASAPDATPNFENIAADRFSAGVRLYSAALRDIFPLEFVAFECKPPPVVTKKIIEILTLSSEDVKLCVTLCVVAAVGVSIDSPEAEIVLLTKFSILITET